MEQVRTLPTGPLGSPALDFALLRAQGISVLERLAGDGWTDFNLHDPGITILEQLCFAITDLAHRTDFPITDLLTDAEGRLGSVLFTPAQALSTRPVTLTDLRKLIIDIDGVKNGWVEPLVTSSTPLFYREQSQSLILKGNPLVDRTIEPKGLYRVLLEPSDLDYLDLNVDGQKLRRMAALRLHANRNLCDDYAEIRVLDIEPVRIDARIEIDYVQRPEALMLDIYRRIADYISPRIPFRSLSEMLDLEHPIDQIFDGPLLEKGFIEDQSLERAQRKTTIHSSDLIQIIMDVPGVRALRTIHLRSGTRSQAWSLPLDKGRAAKFDSVASQIVLEHNGLPVSVDRSRVAESFYYAILREEQGDALPAAARDLPLPRGRHRSVGDYESIQHHLPDVYALGNASLSPSAGAERIAEVKQLQAYLLLFDQILSNLHEQLSGAARLFSTSDVNGPTYFSQLVSDDTLRLESIRSGSAIDQGLRLQQLTEEAGSSRSGPGTPMEDRRSRFLSHLLARIGDDFDEYALLNAGLPAGEAQDPRERLRADMARCLQDFPSVSQSRGLGVNYLAAPAAATSNSGLVKRIQRKLGLDPAADELPLLIEHILLRPIEQDEEQLVPFLTSAGDGDPFSLSLTLIFADWPARFADVAFRALVERTVRAETPAHLAPAIRWVDPAAMETIRSTYDAWLAARSALLRQRLGVST